jgi:DNA-binding NarL/FixJ family response regulator
MAIAAEPDTILLAYKPDIILLALGNPGGNEMGTLETLRKSLPETPILALTSSEVEGQEQAALEAGARMVLTKAAPRTELIRQLREMRTQAIMSRPAVEPEMGKTKKPSIGSPSRSVPGLENDFSGEIKLIRKNADVCTYKQERKIL